MSELASWNADNFFATCPTPNHMLKFKSMGCLGNPFFVDSQSTRGGCSSHSVSIVPMKQSNYSHSPLLTPYRLRITL